MSIFGDIWSKVTSAVGITASATEPAVPVETGTPNLDPGSEVHVEQILTTLAASKPDASNWQTSIVDLLKVLDLDPSLENRKELANELNVHAGADGSAEQNTALHRAVMAKFEESGGKVPDSLKV